MPPLKTRGPAGRTAGAGSETADKAGTSVRHVASVPSGTHAGRASSHALLDTARLLRVTPTRSLLRGHALGRSEAGGNLLLAGGPGNGLGGAPARRNVPAGRNARPIVLFADVPGCGPGNVPARGDIPGKSALRSISFFVDATRTRWPPRGLHRTMVFITTYGRNAFGICPRPSDRCRGRLVLVAFRSARFSGAIGPDYGTILPAFLKPRFRVGNQRRTLHPMIRRCVSGRAFAAISLWGAMLSIPLL